MRSKNPDLPENAFVKQIFDKETGKSMKCRFREDEEVQQIFSVGWWDRDSISYDRVMSQVVDALHLEKKKARHARDLLGSKVAAREKEIRMSELSLQAQKVFEDMTRIETPELQFYQMKERGEITEEEYQARRTEILKQLSEKEKDFDGVTGRMEELNKAFSEKNPWIRTYADMEVPETLTKAQVRKWIARVTVDRLTTVEVVLPEQYAWWKQQLPVQLVEGRMDRETHGG